MNEDVTGRQKKASDPRFGVADNCGQSTWALGTEFDSFARLFNH